jgi:aldehyde:ferredoxin oxidoreductase
MMKKAGYDHIIITGKSAKPGYLMIMDDDVEICNAIDLWGNKDIYKTTDDLMNLC